VNRQQGKGMIRVLVLCVLKLEGDKGLVASLCIQVHVRKRISKLLVLRDNKG
jgi:hypothetical protein